MLQFKNYCCIVYSRCVVYPALYPLYNHTDYDMMYISDIFKYCIIIFRDKFKKIIQQINYVVIPISILINIYYIAISMLYFYIVHDS